MQIDDDKIPFQFTIKDALAALDRELQARSLTRVDYKVSAPFGTAMIDEDVVVLSGTCTRKPRGTLRDGGPAFRHDMLNFNSDHPRSDPR